MKSNDNSSYTQEVKKKIRLVAKKILPKKILSNLKFYLNPNRELKIYFKDEFISIDREKKSVQGLIPVFYWDRVSNFGDTIGPFLISEITGKPVLNIFNNDFSGLMTVGSIIQAINRNDMTIWGSGLIEKPTKELLKNIKEYNPRVLSVRGKKTAEFLLEAGLDVPDQSVYGDPGLILPLFYKPKIHKSNLIGLCPHFMHKPYFLESLDITKGLKIIDVQLNMKSVVDDIISSSVCISTSLHGLIIAQAYGIPWVWLEVVDKNVIGNDFKFRDFFSTIDESKVSHVQISLDNIANIDFKAIASKATLPEKLYDENLILEVLQKYLSE